MSNQYTIKNEMPRAVDPIYSLMPSEEKKVIDCAVCGKVEVPSSYIVYKFNGKKFCCHTHKHQYIREHPEERELTYSEAKAEESRWKVEREKIRYKEGKNK